MNAILTMAEPQKQVKQINEIQLIGAQDLENDQKSISYTFYYFRFALMFYYV